MSAGLESAFLTANSAVTTGNFEKYQELVERFPEIVNMLIGEEGLLHAAVPGSRRRIIKDLLERGADPDGGTPPASELARTSEIKRLFEEHKKHNPEKKSENVRKHTFGGVLAGR